ncbi:MAG: transcription termination/antitermination protein NusG [Cytophagales bacterium]|nr:transcription termination/antitermination protein NusG [Cytophagales bacterium]
MSAYNWYVVKVVSGEEKKIKSYMQVELRREKCDDMVDEILVPSRRVYEMRGGKKRMRDKSFYPGYILLHANLKGGKLVDLLTNLPGVLGFLGTEGRTKGSEPSVLRKAEVNRILSKIGYEGEEGEVAEEEVIESQFVVGGHVKIVDGPFAGFGGSIEAVHEDKRKLNVKVKIFGRETPVEISYYQVEKQL